MEWLNYHHLLYFWAVAKEGSIARACEKLRLAQPTISGQLRMLEEALGEKLFTKAGRGLAMTEAGRVVFGYADEIFSLGRELQDVLKGRPHGRPLRLVVGVSDVVPKLITYRVLEPVLGRSEPVQLVCLEDTPERLVSELIEHRLDVVLADSPVTPIARVKVFNHLLGSCGVSVFAAPSLAVRYRRNFPGSLAGAPFLLPVKGSSLRRSFEQWLDGQGTEVRLVAEFEDSALMKTFGEAGTGLFVAPSVIEREVRSHYKVRLVGRVEAVREQIYAITAERKLKHPAVVTITREARDRLFAQPGGRDGETVPASGGLTSPDRAGVAAAGGERAASKHRKYRIITTETSI